MKTYKNLFQELCSYENLFIAFKKAKKHKTLKPYVIEFNKDLKNNLLQLRADLLFHSYRPKPLETFVIHDPKTRVINKSQFGDRIVHHALCNIIQPLTEKSFIYDSYANRIGKGTLSAIKRFEFFIRKVSRNYSLHKNNILGYVLKADIKSYFENVDHSILLEIIRRKIKDPEIIKLITIILKNYSNKKGMPLGNLTSQFLANVYLNELDQFVKHDLKVKYYLRYVDDFVILHSSKEELQFIKVKIEVFLNDKLKITLHKDKTKIFPLYSGTKFLGFRIFHDKRLINKKNIIKFKKRFSKYCLKYENNALNYDTIYDFLEGWFAYSNYADNKKIRDDILLILNTKFKSEVSRKEVNRLIRNNLFLSNIF